MSDMQHQESGLIGPPEPGHTPPPASGSGTADGVGIAEVDTIECPYCSGRGTEDWYGGEACDRCDGTGTRPRATRATIAAAYRELADWIEATDLDLPPQNMADNDTNVHGPLIYYFWLNRGEDVRGPLTAAAADEAMGGGTTVEKHGDASAVVKDFGCNVVARYVLPETAMSLDVIDDQIAALSARRSALTSAQEPSA